MEVEKQQNLDSAFPFWKPIPRRFRPDSPFFAPGNLERELLAKQVLFFSFPRICKFKLFCVQSVLELFEPFILKMVFLPYPFDVFQRLPWN